MFNVITFLVCPASVATGLAQHIFIVYFSAKRLYHPPQEHGSGHKQQCLIDLVVLTVAIMMSNCNSISRWSTKQNDY